MIGALLSYDDASLCSVEREITREQYKDIFVIFRLFSGWVEEGSHPAPKDGVRLALLCVIGFMMGGAAPAREDLINQTI